MTIINQRFGIQLDDVNYVDREAVYGILINNNKVLIIKTPRGYFLPGGGVEDDESFEDCLKREMIEETGLKVTVLSYIGKSVLHDLSPKNNIYYNMYGSFYFVKQIGITQKTEHDHDVVYMDFDEAIDNLKLVHQKWAIKQIILLRET